MSKSFGSVYIGQVFIYGGIWWRKCSSRTAESLDRPEIRFFRKNEVVVLS